MATQPAGNAGLTGKTQPAAQPFRGGGGRDLIYAGAAAGGTTLGAHQIGDTSILFSQEVARFRPASPPDNPVNMRLVVARPGVNAFSPGGLELHRIVSINEATNRVEIAEPGLLAYYASGTVCNSVPMFGADDSLVLPNEEYTELSVDMFWSMLTLTGSTGFSSGRGFCNGSYFAGHASWYKTQSATSYWQAGTNMGQLLPSFSVGGLIRFTNLISSKLANFWTLEYELAGHRLIFEKVYPTSVDEYHPQITNLIISGG